MGYLWRYWAWSYRFGDSGRNFFSVKKPMCFILFPLLFLCTALMLGADLGGLMVYKFGIGVEAVSPAANNVLHAHGQDNK
jgi:hypothetical protein